MSKLKYYDGTNWKIVNGQITGDTLPIGSIMPYGSTTAPANWLVCDGSAVSRTTYAELFSVIGTSFGSGDGSTTFNLPNLKGKVAVGQDTNDTDFDTIGETGGSKTHTLTLNNLPNTVRYPKYNGTEQWGLAEQNGAHYPLQDGGNTAFSLLQPYQTVNYIIKAKQSAGVVANVSNIRSDSTTDTYSCDYINGVLLYDNSTGSAGEITLSDSIDNYSRIKIFYSSTVEDSYEFKPKSGETSKIALGTKYKTGSLFIQTIGTYNCSTNKLTPQLAECGYATVSSSGSAITWDNTNYCSIKTVIGYK